MKLGKIRFQKKYIAFLTVVPLLMVSSIFQVDCPVCEGSGRIASTPSMNNVEIVNFESNEVYVTREVCDAFIAYKYDLTLLLKNNGLEQAEGWIKMVLKDLSKGTVMDTQYLLVNLPGETKIEATYAIWFGTGLDVAGLTEIFAEVITGDIPDDICDGRGRVPLNIWFLLNGFKDNFKEITRIQHEYKPPVWYPPETEGGGWNE